MAVSTEFSSELLKLRKDQLIEIILNKCVPNTISVSKELQRYIEDNINNDLTKLQENNLKNSIPYIKMENELKIIKTELECSKTIVATLKTSVSDKELIISLLQKHNQVNLDPRNCNVADVVKKSQNQGNLPGAKPLYLDVANAPKKVPKQGNQNQPINSSGKQENGKELTNKNKNKIVGSNMEEKCFKSVPRRAFVHLGRVHPKTTPDDIKKYVVSTFKRNDFVIEPCPVRDEAKSVSFKIETDISILENLYSSENWPKGVTINRYRFFRSQTSAAEF